MTVTSGRRNARYTVLPVDGPVPSEMIRAVPGIIRDPLAFLGRTVGRYGDLVAFPMPRTPVLLVNAPAAARHVLVDNHRGYGKRTVQYTALSAVTGQGLLTADGQLWRAHRRILQPAFRHDGVTVAQRVPAQVVDSAERLRTRWDAARPGEALDAEAAVLETMLEVVGYTLFDDDLAPVSRQVGHAVEVALRRVVRQARSPLPGRWPTPGRYRMRRAVASLDRVVRDVVQRRRQRGVGAQDPDLLAMLLRSDLDDRQVRDELVTLVIAGHETVASALTWSLGLLAATPDVQDRLLAELDRVLAGQLPVPDDLPALSYTRAVIDESLRLYPPVWVLTRRALADDVVTGVPIPAGTLLLISPWLLHRRADCWPDPGRFDPGRFLAGTPAAAGAGAYLPFGAGPRMCIGRDIALVEAVLVLATLLRDRRVVRPGGAGLPRADALVTLRPHGGLPILLLRR